MCANMTDVKVRQIESSVDNLFVNNNFKCPLEVDQQTYEFPRGTGNSEIHDKWNERLGISPVVSTTNDEVSRRNDVEHKFNVGRQLPEEPSSTFESDSAKPETDKESKETFVTSEADTINQQTMSDTGYVEQSSDAAIPDPSVIAVDRTDCLKAVSVISAPEDSSTNEVSSNYSWMVDRVGCNTDASPLESEHTIDEKEERDSGDNSVSEVDVVIEERKRRRITKCDVCNELLSKYCCPKCSLRTCSLICVKRHKMENGCDGVRNRVGYVPLNSFGELALLSDYRFLEEAGRCVDNAFRYPLKRKKNNHKMSYWQYRLVSECKQRHTCLLILPTNFQRRKLNNSYYDTRTRNIFWNIEWDFAQAGVKSMDERISEDLPLGKALEPYLSPDTCKEDIANKLCYYQSAGFSGVIPLMKVERLKIKGSQYKELNFSKSLRQNLAKTTVVEFPTVVLVLKHHIGFYPIFEKRVEDLEEGEILSFGESDDDEEEEDGEYPCYSKGEIPRLFSSEHFDSA